MELVREDAAHVADTASVALDRDAVGRYVLGRRTPSGGYCFYRTSEWGVEEPNAPDTLAALASLRLLALPAPVPEATVAWLAALQSAGGCYPTLTIGWAAMRAMELLGSVPLEPPGPWLAACAERYLLGNGPGRRDWRGAILDVSRMLELAAGEDGPVSELKEAAIGLLHRSRDPLGGWARPGPDLETTAVALHLQELAGLCSFVDPTTAALIGRCEDPVLGLRIAPGSGATSAGALWGGLEALRVVGRRPRFPAAINRSLVLMQRPNGGLGARHRALATLQDTWRGLQAASLLDDVEEGS